MKFVWHKSVLNTSTYQKDTATLYVLIMREESTCGNQVCFFKSIFLQLHTHGSVATWSTPYQRDPPDLVEWWYGECLGLDPMVPLIPVQL
jgi:hypothetical protein